MNSFRGKLALGFGGLLLILLLVSTLTIVFLTRSSNRLQTLIRENYDSVVYCQNMKLAMQTLNLRAEQRTWHDQGEPVDVPSLVLDFNSNLQKQLDNCTLPDEATLTRQLQRIWEGYEQQYEQLQSPAADRARIYHDQLLPRAQNVLQLAQRLADMNTSNLVSADGRARQTLVEVRDALLLLVFGGTLLATVVIAAVGASMLHQLQAITRSAQQIEKGNLDHPAEVYSNDEIGQLAHAFNSMASRLREFRKLDHERLQRTQQTTQLAIDSLPDAVFVVGPEGKVEISNRTAHAHFGIDPGTDIPSLHLKWLDDLVARVEHDQIAIESSGYQSALQLFEDGVERFLLPRAVPMVGAQGDRIGVTVILADVTRLRQADEIKSGLVSTVSHELRTPLTSLRMSVNLLADARLGPLAPRQKDLVVAAREEVNRLYRTIENLLNYARIESGRAQFQFRQMGIGELSASAVDAIGTSFLQKGVELRNDVRADLPTVMADPNTIDYVLGNLLSNALKFTPAGGNVSLSAQESGELVEIAVSDTGPGVPPQFVGRLFEKFFRVPTPTGPSGAGLGLAIAKEIIEAHGGHIEYRPRPGGGSVFCFTLRSASSPIGAGLSS